MPKLINKSQAKVIETIFKNPGINLNEIINKTSLSPNFVSKQVNYLVEKNVLKEERLEKKRVYLRRFYLNFKSQLTKNLFMLVKEEQKEGFFEEYPELKPVLSQTAKEVNMEFLLIYGSYARLAAEKDSDLDILIVGNVKNKNKIREILVSLEMELSIKIESLKKFKKRIDEALHQQIIKENILIYDSGKFLEFLENFYNRKN